MKKMPKLMTTILAAFALFALSSCQTHTQRGALHGGLGGAAIGAAVAGDGNRAEGALIGGAIGSAAGAAVGSGKDRRHRHYH